MIDTDKYEGQAEGEWIIQVLDDGLTWNIQTKSGEQLADMVIGKHLGNAILMRDAPLLLAEVKRLNMVINMLKKNDLWVSQEGWEESDKDDELLVSMNYLIQGFQDLRGDFND